MITTTDLRPLLHLVGQHYDFSYSDWKWFAKRYSMDMDEINPDQLNVAWYHRRLSEHLTPRSDPGISDLQYWVSIRRPVTLVEPSAAEAVVEETAVAPEKMAEPEETPEPEEAPELEEAMDNPLTNDIPAAVIMGAADADEKLAEEPETTGEDPSEEDKPAEADPSAKVDATAEEEASGDTQ
jgi:hypothetical protein